MNIQDKLSVFNILINQGFYSMKHTKGLNSASIRDALYHFPKEIAKNRNPRLPAIENESDKLQGEGVKTFIPSNVIEIYTGFEIF